MRGPMPVGSDVHSDVDDLSTDITVEEPQDSPALLCEGMDNGEPGGLCLMEGGVDVVDED